jgi:hypothetical protein
LPVRDCNEQQEIPENWKKKKQKHLTLGYLKNIILHKTVSMAFNVVALLFHYYPHFGPASLFTKSKL